MMNQLLDGRPWHSFRILAVIVGGATDIILTNVLVGCYTFVFLAGAVREMVAQGLPQAEMQAQLMNQYSNSPANFVLGTLGSFVGGYVAGRIANMPR